MAAFDPGTWQSWIQQQAQALGLTVTSGYRSPQREAQVNPGVPYGGSYHSQGTPGAPGAVDIGGPASKLTQLYQEVKQAFQGRINELYLNLPGGGSQDIRNNKQIGINPEAGNPQHLHVALNASTGPNAGPVGPGRAIPLENQSETLLGRTGGTSTASSSSECYRQWCMPQISPFAQPNCHCWSDTWIYGFSVAVILAGAWLMFNGSKQQ